MRQIPHLIACCLVALAALAVAGCGPQSPEEKVAAARAKYSVKLERFTVKEPAPAVDEMAYAEPAAEGEMVAEAAAMAAEASEEAAAGEEAMEEDEVMEDEVMEDEVMESGPRPADVILHLLVGFSGDEALPGITVEVTQADPFGKEKEPTLHWIDTAGMAKSDVKQVDLELTGVEYEDGDAFSVLLRQDVPAAERGSYREFAEAGP